MKYEKEIETAMEDRIMSAAQTMILVGVALVLFAAVFMVGVAGTRLLKHGAVGEANAGKAVVVETALEDGAPSGMNGGKIDLCVRTRGERRLDVSAADGDFHDGERDMADVGDHDLAAAETSAEPGRDGSAGDVAELLAPDGAPGEASCNHRAEGRKDSAGGHDPLDDGNAVHGGHYTK